MNTPNISPAQRLQEYIDSGRLIRGQWTDTDEHGRHLACLLAAMAPECGEDQTAASCPAEVMPRWLAHLTPWMDDCGSDDAWPAMVRRYANLTTRWHMLTDEDWRRLDYMARLVSLRECRVHCPSAVDPVIALCERAAGGDYPTQTEWRAAAKTAAEKAATEWAAGAAGAAWAATKAETAETAATEVAEWAAEEEAAVDRITTGILDAIEAAIKEREV